MIPTAASLSLVAAYENFVGKSIRFKWLYLIGDTERSSWVSWLSSFSRIPGSFLPEEDQGIMFTLVQLPAGSTLNETQDVLDKVSDYYENARDR